MNKPEIRFKDYYRFRSYYCGLCCSLKDRYGNAGRMALGYDMTFLVVLLSGLYDTDTAEDTFRCIAHPVRRRGRRTNEFTHYCADMNMLLTWHKCMDDWADERKLSRLLYAGLIRRRVRRAEARWPEKSRVFAQQLKEQRRLEQENSRDLDAVAGCFGRIMAELFACRQDHWEQKLRQMGFYLGKYIYLLDAYDDVFEDETKGCYNPFADICHADDFDEQAEAVLRLMIAESAAVFETLPVEENMEILRNILYSGVWRSFELIRLRRRKEAQENQKDEALDHGQKDASHKQTNTEMKKELI